jgi:hypothetical protein
MPEASPTINSTYWAKSRLLRVRIAVIGPINDLVWTKYRYAIEATAKLTAFNFCTVIAALLVGNTQRMAFG